jgi:flagellar motor switch/type III secretory pathway protein FliN
MSDHEEILTFRRREENPAEPAGLAGGPRQSPQVAAVATPDAEGQRDVLPFARPRGPQPFTWQDLREEQPAVPVHIRLGKTRLPAGDANPPAAGAILVLDRSIDEPVEIVVAGQVVGLGRLVVAHNKLAIQVCQVIRGGRARSA